MSVLPAEKVLNPNEKYQDLTHSRENSFVDNTKKKIQVEGIKFNWSYATKCLSITFMHFFFGPISIPILWWIFGKNLVKNMQYRISWIYFVIELTGWIWVLSTITLLLIDSENTMYLLPSMIATGFIYVMRHLLTSLKYGYYSDSVWSKINKKTLPQKKLTKYLIITSWMKVPLKVAKKELLESFKRQFLFPDSRFLSFEGENAPENNLCLRKFSEMLVVKVSETAKTKTTFVFILSAGYAFLPLPMVLYKHGSEIFEMNPLEYAYSLFFSIMTMLLARAFLLFIVTGICDFDRKRKLMAQCSALISCQHNSELLIDCPLIDIYNINSIMSWYYMRTAFLDFGQRYTRRVFMYISLTLPICLLSIVILFLMMFKVIETEFSFYFVPGVYLVIVVMSILCYMVSAAVELNKYFVLHRDILLNLIAHIRNSGEDRENIISTLWTIIEKLKQDELLRPVKIMGIAVDSALYTKLATVAVSGLFALMRVFYAS